MFGGGINFNSVTKITGVALYLRNKLRNQEGLDSVQPIFKSDLFWLRDIMKLGSNSHSIGLQAKLKKDIINILQTEFHFELKG